MDLIAVFINKNNWRSRNHGQNNYTEFGTKMKNYGRKRKEYERGLMRGQI